MRCDEVHPLLVALRDGELAPAQVTFVERHLDVCAACRALDEALESVTPRPPELPDSLPLDAMWERLDAAVAAELARPQPLAKRSRWSDVRTRFADDVVVSANAALLYAAALLLVGLWGAAQWRTAQELQVALDEVHGVPATYAGGPADVVPADAYREAAWSPSTDGTPTSAP